MRFVIMVGLSVGVVFAVIGAVLAVIVGIAVSIGAGAIIGVGMLAVAVVGDCFSDVGVLFK